MFSHTPTFIVSALAIILGNLFLATKIYKLEGYQTMYKILAIVVLALISGAILHKLHCIESMQVISINAPEGQVITDDLSRDQDISSSDLAAAELAAKEAVPVAAKELVGIDDTTIESTGGFLKSVGDEIMARI